MAAPASESIPRPYRYERKFLVAELDASQLHHLVRRHPALFRPPYPPRYINNLYLDSPDLENYAANVGGQHQRRKLRVRWYGELFGAIAQPVLEIKLKDGLVGNKLSYPLPSFHLEPGLNQRQLQALFRQAELPAFLRQELRDLQAVLCNRYYRWYYATPTGEFRATIDARLSYYPLRHSNNRFRPVSHDYQNVILELKYERDLDQQANRIAGFFPFRMTRSSKYVTGIERVFD
ncbi:MAG: polyphosphate polymerase domain-containing protein [Anaerolineales bacterium]|nr:polyphosphate polymerase domain-containing protein [Anaerolineales bacterium]